MLNTLSNELVILMIWGLTGFAGGLILILHDLFRGYSVSMKEGGFVVLCIICPILGPIVLYQIILDVILGDKKNVI